MKNRAQMCSAMGITCIWMNDQDFEDENRIQLLRTSSCNGFSFGGLYFNGYLLSELVEGDNLPVLRSPFQHLCLEPVCLIAGRSSQNGIV